MKDTKPPPAAAVETKKQKPKPKETKDEEECLDYSHLYSCFYDIFVGYQTDSKQFDTNFALRETRNIYASFVNLMEGTQAVVMQQKVKFDANPLEKAYRDH